MTLTEFLKTKRYPGRFIVIGRDAGESVVIYGATGRSPASLARRFVQKGNEIFMTAADETVAQEGNPELLEYPAVKILEHVIVVANGRQIENIKDTTDSDVEGFVGDALSSEMYEPDEYSTPRITGLVQPAGDYLAETVLHIVSSVSGAPDRRVWPLVLEEGEGCYIATYTGEDVKPTPSFQGAPLPVSLDFGSAEAAARGVFEALAPPDGKSDYRVGIVAVYRREGKTDIKIKNRL